MDKFNSAKKQFESIKCDNDFKNKVNKIIKKKRFGHKAAITAAASAAACIAVLNTVTAIPISAQGIPVVEQIVNVVTFGRFVAHDGGFEADIKTPKIEGLAEKELEKKLNNEFKENADAIKSQYIKDAKQIKKEFGTNGAHMHISMDYSIKTDTADYLALDVYVFTASGSSSTKHSYYNIDKRTKKLITLDDVYKDTPNYREKMKEYIYSEMVRRNKEEDGIFWLKDDQFGWEDAEKALDENTKFYITSDKKIVICFDKYEIAAGAQGCPEFEIPDSVLKPSV